MTRCDKSMRRSKEQCMTPLLTRWRCTGECSNCICGMFQKDDGTWEHNGYEKAHKKKEKSDD